MPPATSKPQFKNIACVLKKFATLGYSMLPPYLKSSFFAYVTVVVLEERLYTVVMSSATKQLLITLLALFIPKVIEGGGPILSPSK